MVSSAHCIKDRRFGHVHEAFACKELGLEVIFGDRGAAHLQAAGTLLPLRGSIRRGLEVHVERAEGFANVFKGVVFVRVQVAVECLVVFVRAKGANPLQDGGEELRGGAEPLLVGKEGGMVLEAGGNV